MPFKKEDFNFETAYLHGKCITINRQKQNISHDQFIFKV